MELVRPNNPALDAEYAVAPLIPFSARSDEMLMIHRERTNPLRFGLALLLWLFARVRMQARSRARDVKMAPSRFVCRICEISSGGNLARMLERGIPAELIRMSTLACMPL